MNICEHLVFVQYSTTPLGILFFNCVHGHIIKHQGNIFFHFKNREYSYKTNLKNLNQEGKVCLLP